MVVAAHIRRQYPSVEAFIVEDDPHVQTLLEEILSQDGRTVTIASSVQEGIDRAQEGVFEWVILDYSLADGIGLDVAHHVSAGCKGILLFSASRLHDKLRNEAAASGVTHCFRKPEDLGELIAFISNS